MTTMSMKAAVHSTDRRSTCTFAMPLVAPGTIQFDFNLPERFDLTYIGDDGQKHRPVMVHRALLGSLERFFGIMVEHYAGSFPVWLAPTQAIVLSVTEKANDYAERVVAQMKDAGLRVRVDVRSEKIGLKIREAELEKIPFMLIVGERESESQTVSLRAHGRQDLGTQPVADVIARLRDLDRPGMSQDSDGAGEPHTQQPG